MIKIRKATIKDIALLKDMKKEFAMEEYARFDKSIDLKYYLRRAMPRRLKTKLKSKNCIYFIAFDGDNPAGFCGGKIEKSDAYWGARRIGLIFNLYVKPQYRRKGMGKKLTLASYDWLKQKKLKLIRLFVYANNPKAHKLYKKLGFNDFMIELNKVV